MLDALRMTWQSLRDLWDDFVLLVMINIVWTLAVALMLAPLLLLGTANLLVTLILTLVLFLPLPIITGALCFVANQITRGNAVGWGTFAAGVRRYWGKSLAVAFLNIVVAVLIASNVQFYALVLEGTWTNFAVSIWLVIGIYWLVAQIYWFPMILELESEKVLVALRNALSLVIISPGFSLAMAVILLVLAALGIVLTVPAPLFLVAFLLLITNHATRSRLALIRSRREDKKSD